MEIRTVVGNTWWRTIYESAHDSRLFLRFVYSKDTNFHLDSHVQSRVLESLNGNFIYFLDLSNDKKPIAFIAAGQFDDGVLEVPIYWSLRPTDVDYGYAALFNNLYNHLKHTESLKSIKTFRLPILKSNLKVPAGVKSFPDPYGRRLEWFDVSKNQFTERVRKSNSF